MGGGGRFFHVPRLAHLHDGGEQSISHEISSDLAGRIALPRPEELHVRHCSCRRRAARIRVRSQANNILDALRRDGRRLGRLPLRLGRRLLRGRTAMTLYAAIVTPATG
jgi:hypothetical protein